ncbi:MAG: class I SAM-dependent methyltransferase, partial [candidate division WOR-3 bacterium]
AQRRVTAAQANAARLNLSNVTVHQMDAMKLEFDDGSFDGVVAANAVEQAPDPFQVLREVFRVLRPGGSFRVYFESYDGRNKGFSEEVFITETADSLGYHYLLRHGQPPWERSYLVKFANTPEMKEEFRKLADYIQRLGANPAQAREIGQQFLERNRTGIIGSSWFELEHFTSQSLKETLEEIGFVNVRIAYSAATLARAVWPRIQNSGLTEQQFQDLCQGLADMAVDLDAPAGQGEPLVATKPK